MGLKLVLCNNKESIYVLNMIHNQPRKSGLRDKVNVWCGKVGVREEITAQSKVQKRNLPAIRKGQ